VRLEAMTPEQYEAKYGDTEYWRIVAQAVLRRENLTASELTRYKYGYNILFALGGGKVLKLFPPFCQEDYRKEEAVLVNLAPGFTGVEVPRLLHTGSYYGWPYIIMSRLPGELVNDNLGSLSAAEKLRLAADLGLLIRAVHSQPADRFQAVDIGWAAFLQRQYVNCLEHHKQSGLKPSLLDHLPAYLAEEYLDYTPAPVLLTGEYTPFNLLLSREDGMRRLSGLVDFADCFLGDGDYDLLGPIAFMFYPEPETVRVFLEGYGYTAAHLTGRLRRKLMIYLLLHRYSDISFYLTKSEKAGQAATLTELAEIFFPF